MQSDVIVNQICIMAVMVLVGVIAAKRKIITTEVKNSIARIVFDITLPLLIFTTFARLDISKELLINGLYVLVFSIIGLFWLILAGRLSAWLLKLDAGARAIHVSHTFLGNIVFLGFPLINALFPGGVALYYAAIFQIASNAVMWTVGVYILNGDEKKKMAGDLSKLLNPNTIAFVLGILLILFRLKLPHIVDKSLGGLGGATLYLSMLYIGEMLAHANYRGLFRRKYVFALSLNKLILAPVVFLFLINKLVVAFSIPLDTLAKAVVILQLAMPCQAILVVLAKKYGKDDEHATLNLFVSTLLSFVSLPVIYYLIIKMP